MIKHVKQPRRRSHLVRRAIGFCGKNGQLLFLLTLIFLGALAATVLYPRLPQEQQHAFRYALTYSTPPTDFLSGCTAVVSSAFYVCLLLMLLFLFGLTPYGWPLILCVLLFFGFLFGLAECQAYTTYDLQAVILSVLIPMGLSTVAMLIGVAQALQMSGIFSRQLLPSSAHCGGMWQDFKLYLIRFMLCLIVAFAAAAVKVLLQCF